MLNIDVHESIIDFTADYIFKSDKKTALISGERRSFLFIKKKLAEKQKKAFFPPEFFTNDEFIERIIFDNTELIKISDIEAAFMIFKIVKNEFPQLLKDKTSFTDFMEWSFEILSFIEQLDLENISEDKLKDVKANAEIGYDVPENINNLLKNIFKIRKSFYSSLEKSSKTTKGHSFLKAASAESNLLAGNFDEIILMAPFYLHKSEIEIFKKIYDAEKLTVFIHGNPRKYKILMHIYSAFGEQPPDIENKKDEYKLNIYSAFDDQSQGALLKNLISDYSENDLDKTVVIVPDSKMLQSVISEISIVTDQYNVFAGYPAKKTPVFSLLNAIIEAQLSRKKQYYYSKDVIKVLTNPFVKNMEFLGERSISRTAVYKIEEALNQDSESYLSSKMFVSFKEIVDEKQLIDEISLATNEVCEYIAPEEIIKMLKEIFYVFFISWEKIETLNNLSFVLCEFFGKIHSLSAAGNYSLNAEAAELLLSLAKELKFGEISQAKFQNEDVLNILKKLIKNKRIVLTGSPLKGLQILGLLESRNLSFENVFIAGMTDSAIPAVKKEYSLMPKDIMYALGIEIAKKEFEIQEYHFDRLIAGAKNLNLIYPDNDKDERSRFIESLIWNKQLENKDINTVKINKFVLPKFSTKQPVKRKYAKTKEIREYLKNMSYTYNKIDAYLSCKLKFYFMHVLLLDEKTKVGQELSAGDIGNFVHSFLKDALYEKLDSKKLQTLEFEKEYFKKFENGFNNFPHFKFREDAFMIKEVLRYRMKNILHYERLRSYKNIYGCEKKYLSNIKTVAGETYKFNCRIDRIDTDGKNYMLFDYKTGDASDGIVSNKYFDMMSNNFDRQNTKKAISSMQLPLYKNIFEKETGFDVLECGIYDIKKAEIIKFPEKKEIYDNCIDAVRLLLDEINAGESFEFGEEDKVNCKICKYFYICT